MVRARLCKLQKGCIRLASDTNYQLLAHGRWFFPGTPVSSTIKTGRHDIAEILLKVTLKHQKSNQKSNQPWFLIKFILYIDPLKFHRGALVFIHQYVSSCEIGLAL